MFLSDLARAEVWEMFIIISSQTHFDLFLFLESPIMRGLAHYIIYIYRSHT